MEVVGQKTPRVPAHICQILLGEGNRVYELLSMTDISLAAQLNERFLVLIENKAVLLAINSELMQSRPHLGRKSKIGSRAFVVADNDSQVIDNFLFAHAPENWTGESISHQLGSAAVDELRDPGDAVADDVLQELSRQTSHPMLLVS
jgi:hypothetical protein